MTVSHSSTRGAVTGANHGSEIDTLDDLLPPGAPVGTIATDLNQSVGLERYELLGKMQGIDVWDMKPLDSSRKGERKAPP